MNCYQREIWSGTSIIILANTNLLQKKLIIINVVKGAILLSGIQFRKEHLNFI